MVRLARLERATLCLEGRCSIHLSYRRTRESAPIIVPIAGNIEQGEAADFHHL
jgi:hypothetical protein